jgi:Ca2+-binding RTX toxin-like protein
VAHRIGTPDADTLLGGDGADFIEGRSGADRAAGGNGNDVVLGGSGGDFLAGDGGLAAAGFPFPPNGDDVVVGGDGDDALFGDAFFYSGPEGGANLLLGGAGNDSVTGGYGADTAFGGSGDDRIQGYGPPGPTAGATVALRDADRADLLLGGAGNDTIDGGGGGDTMLGGPGDDWLIGGAGNDTMAGGTGADRFVFAPTGLGGTRPDTGRGEGNRDVVTDFDTGADLLDLSGYRNAGVRWEYDAGQDRTIVTVAGASGPAFPGFEIELRGVRDLSPDDVLLA